MSAKQSVPAFSLPWQMTERLNHNDIPEVGVESVGEYGVIFVVDHAEKEDRQNARFIVQACNVYPDLVETLESAPILSKFHGDKGFDVEGFIVAYDAWRAKARAALKKARGEAR